MRDQLWALQRSLSPREELGAFGPAISASVFEEALTQHAPDVDALLRALNLTSAARRVVVGIMISSVTLRTSDSQLC